MQHVGHQLLKAGILNTGDTQTQYSIQRLREVVRTIWPQLTPNRHQICVLDAAAMGLFIQTERLFNNF